MRFLLLMCQTAKLFIPSQSFLEKKQGTPSPTVRY